MIKVTRLDGRQIVVNADLIELIEATPDTILSLTSEHKLIIKESLDEVVKRVVAYRQRIYRQRPQLHVLPTHDS